MDLFSSQTDLEDLYLIHRHPSAANEEGRGAIYLFPVRLKRHSGSGSGHSGSHSGGQCQQLLAVWRVALPLNLTTKRLEALL
eukprot:8677954-Prorocentrum_lima.AAC.1